MRIKGLYQALGVTAYISLIGFFMINGEKIFGNAPNYIGPVVGLLLFSVSVLICGLIVFYQPYNLFFIANKKKEAIDLVVQTTAWLFGFFIVALLLAAL
ncbi:hypothetical protein A2803_01550 [Candidatus Woesebacteria bacterium RIFCSPHIGHO2_01_FULL_44_21]|uniref:Uncharacterized protein n=1 Tax=Candidatus Woesebacteria bacterium RIFCSPHIGHO2_01_FULL_44_21 TaxID=1802503 RepID=A0A1F7YUV9_9BACT|nr:MAG: hypothetical protein A2803_01550 [Candidatus Woesebacteria bacterium RIFCSPHIGHO2_01_FULL_44_21]OGM69558.1 MAG: hypothetical protein A2897_03065 [Candidatus Woesebacteria bacterium RIFCSPLOWO2_01_FULL_44_24b]